MTAVANRIATPGSLYQALEQDILQNKEKVAALTKERRCKVIQAVALSALCIIATVAAFVVASIFAPNYAPIVLFVGAYLLIDRMVKCIRTNFRDKWTQLDREIEKIQAIAKKHLQISTDAEYQNNLAKTFSTANEAELKKYTYLAAHYEYWQEVFDNTLKAHYEKHKEAEKIEINPLKKDEKLIKKYVNLMVRSQQLREEALQARVQAASVCAITARPDCTPKEPLFVTHYAPIPLPETDNDLTVNVSLFESNWAQHLLSRDLPPYDAFFVSTRKGGLSFSRSDITYDVKFQAEAGKGISPYLDVENRPAKPIPAKPLFEMMIDEIVATMDEQAASAG